MRVSSHFFDKGSISLEQVALLRSKGGKKPRTSSRRSSHRLNLHVTFRRASNILSPFSRHKLRQVLNRFVYYPTKISTPDLPADFLQERPFYFEQGAEVGTTVTLVTDVGRFLEGTNRKIEGTKAGDIVFFSFLRVNFGTPELSFLLMPHQ